MTATPRSHALPVGGRHLPALDGVRGIAILLVLAHHFAHYSRMGPRSLVDTGVTRVLESGWFGVDLFFVLSGFLITGILRDTRDDPHYFRTFYGRRALRILPVYYATLAVWFFALPLVYRPPPGFDELFARQWWYWTHLVNIDVALGGWPNVNHLAHFWSLAIEEQFYLVWPLVVLRTSRRGLMRVCIACIALAAALRIAFVFLGTDPVAVYVSTLCRMDQLALGGLLALWVRDGLPLPRARRLRSAALILGGGGMAVLFASASKLDTYDWRVATFGYTLTALLGAGLVLHAVYGEKSGAGVRALTSAPLVAAGRYSYALYVVHHPLIVMISNRGVRASLLPDLAGSRLPALALIALFVGLASFIVALASWHLLETPFLRLKRHVRYSEASTHAIARTT